MSGRDTKLRKNTTMKKRWKYSEMIEFLRDAFPLKFRFVVIGVLHGLIMEVVMLYPNNLPPFSGLASIIWPRFIPGFRRNYWRHYAGWTSVGMLAGAIPYDFFAEQSTFVSSVLLVIISLAVMAIHFFQTHLRRQEPESEDPVADAAEESKKRLQEKEEEQIRKIAEENARNRRS